MSNVTNYYSVTDNISQLIVDFWHMLLVNDDDVGFSLAFFVRLCYDLHILKNIFILFYLVCVRVRLGVCMINQHSMPSHCYNRLLLLETYTKGRTATNMCTIDLNSAVNISCTSSTVHCGLSF